MGLFSKLTNPISGMANPIFNPVANKVNEAVTKRGIADTRNQWNKLSPQLSAMGQGVSQAFSSPSRQPAPPQTPPPGMMPPPQGAKGGMGGGMGANPQGVIGNPRYLPPGVSAGAAPPQGMPPPGLPAQGPPHQWGAAPGFGKGPQSPMAQQMALANAVRNTPGAGGQQYTP